MPITAVGYNNGHLYAGYADGTIAAHTPEELPMLWWERTPIGKVTSFTQVGDSLLRLR